MGAMGFLVRPWSPRDVKDVMRMIKEIAVIYHVPLETIKTSEEELEKVGFGPRPRIKCFVAEVPPEQKSKEGNAAEGGNPLPHELSSGHTIVGYSLGLFTYNTWRGKTFYLDNLYVIPEFRGKGIGAILYGRAAELAWSQGATEMRMHISEEQPNNIAFQVRRNAQDLTAQEGWNLFRFEEPAMRRRAAESKF